MEVPIFSSSRLSAVEGAIDDGAVCSYKHDDKAYDSRLVLRQVSSASVAASLCKASFFCSHIERVVGFVQEANFLVVPYLGVALDELMEQRAISRADVFAIGNALFTTLQTLHSLGLAHGSIDEESITCVHANWTLKCVALPPPSSSELLIAAQGDDVEAAAALLSRLFLSLPPTSTPQRVPSMKSALHRWWSRLLAPSRGPSTQDVRAHGAPAALADLLSRAKLPDASARPPASELRRAFATAAQLDCECAVHGDVIPAGCPSVCCTGSPAHRVCSACLAAYVASQCDRLADAFAVHQGSFPCREMGMECDGVLPRAEVVRAFSGEPAELFLRGMLAGGAARGAREAESRRKEQAEDGGAREERVRRHVNEIAELQADACPRCRVRFIDKEPGQCMVLKCGNPQCRVGAVSTMFCAWCLADLGTSSSHAHRHVRSCQYSLNRGSLFASEHLLCRRLKERAKARTLHYMRNSVPPDVAGQVATAANFILTELGLGDTLSRRVHRAASRFLAAMGMPVLGTPRMPWEEDAEDVLVRMGTEFGPGVGPREEEGRGRRGDGPLSDLAMAMVVALCCALSFWAGSRAERAGLWGLGIK